MQSPNTLVPGQCPHCKELNLLKATLCVRCHRALPPLPPHIQFHLYSWPVICRRVNFFAALFCLIGGFIFYAVNSPDFVLLDEPVPLREIPLPNGKGPLIVTSISTYEGSFVVGFVRIQEEPAQYIELTQDAEDGSSAIFAWSKDGTIVARFNSENECLKLYDSTTPTDCPSDTDNNKISIENLFRERGGMVKESADDNYIHREIWLSEYKVIQASSRTPC